MLRMITIVGMVIALSACSSSSGGGGGSKESTLDSTADGAAVGGAAATAGLQAVTLSSSLKSGMDETTLSPRHQQGKFRMAASVAEKTRQMSKAAKFAPIVIPETSYPCDSGDYVEEFTFDDATGDMSGSTTYNDCRWDWGDGSYSIENGSEVFSLSSDNGSLSMDMTSSNYSWADYDSSGNIQYKSLESLTMSADFNETFTTFTITMSGKDEYSDYVYDYYETNTYTKVSMTGTAADDLWTSATMTMNGKEKTEISDSGEEWSETISMTDMAMTTTSDNTFSLDGKMSLSSTPASCSDGTYTYETIVPMTIGYYGDVIAGEIKINGAYTITYLADGSVTVTDSEGSEITYTADEMANICSLG